MGKSYAITGHTRGIGKYLWENLPWGTRGFSKSNGFDITFPHIRKLITDEVHEVDIFINNAQQGYSQTDLLIELASMWRNDSSKTIVSIGSNVTEVILPANFSYLDGYKKEKALLKRMCSSIQSSRDYQCKIVYKTFGFVGTPTILKQYPHFTKQDYISIESAGNYILELD